MSQTVRPQNFARLLDSTLSAFNSLGLREPSLEVEDLVAQAAASSGHEPPAEGRYLEPLRAITDAAKASTTLSHLGRQLLTRSLRIRLQNHFAREAWFKEHPETEDEPIEHPVFIVAPPRTGTTMLHRLLAVHPEHRVLYAWEMDQPLRPQRKGKLIDSRKLVCSFDFMILNQLCPDLRHIHEARADYPEECINLLANELTSVLYALFYDLPGYVEYLHQADMEPVYRAHRRQLQLLQARGPRRRWVLKAPFHLLGLEALLRVYPDALIIQTHRDPAEVLASEASLFQSLRRAFHTSTDLYRLGQERLEGLGLWLDRALQARERHGDDAFIDIQYLDLIRNPMTWVATIADRLGEPLTEDVRQAMSRHHTQHRQHRHGKHRYSLDQFGLDEHSVRQRFAQYTERFLPGSVAV